MAAGKSFICESQLMCVVNMQIIGQAMEKNSWKFCKFQEGIVISLATTAWPREAQKKIPVVPGSFQSALNAQQAASLPAPGWRHS